MRRALPLALLVAVLCAAKAPEPNGDEAARVELGKRLFFDKRLSSDGTVSCATCHDPKKGWSDAKPVSTGVHGLKGKRNAPTLLNVKDFSGFFFWDGRAATLEEQAVGPLITKEEMGLSSPHEAEEIVRSIKGYAPFFRAAFGDETVSIARVAQALSDFERSLISMDSPYDRYELGDEKALTVSQKRGMKLVLGSASCSACHSGPSFSDSHFHNIGVGVEKTPPDEGRFEISKRQRDHGAYKTPTLRNLARSGPYMHDGSIKTLREVVDFYDKGGVDNPWLDPDVQPLHLTEQQKRDIVAFLEALNGDPRLIKEPPPVPKEPAAVAVER